MSANGTLAYLDAPDLDAAANTLVEVDRQRLEEPLELPVGRYGHPRLSPDGSRVAFVQDREIKVWDLDQRRISR